MLTASGRAVGHHCPVIAFVWTLVAVSIIGGSFFLIAMRPSRRLPDGVCQELAAIPMRRRGQHIVDLQLRDGRVVEKVWIAYGKYVALIGGRTRSHSYTARDVIHATDHAGR